MDYEIRYAREDEFEAVIELDGANFGISYGPGEIAAARVELHADRILVAAVGDRLIGVSAELPFGMTLPGGGEVPIVGLTWVSVELTHRRRGVLRALVERQLRTAADAGIAAAALGASEGMIYGRYGFGVATSRRKAVVQRRRARLATPVDTSAVRRLSADEAPDVLPALYERWRAQTPGAVTRDAQRWQHRLLDGPAQREGRSALLHLVHPDGYVSYRVKENWGDGDPQHECAILDYVVITAEAHAALWQALLGMDLVGTIMSFWIPLDDPLPLLLADPRAIGTAALDDGMWLRPLDVPALLGGRTYGVEIDCVLGVRDELLGSARYLLRGGPDGASCTRTDRLPDVELGVGELGALVLGGTRLLQLARAGLVTGADPALLRRLDLALLADRLPNRGTGF